MWIYFCIINSWGKGTGQTAKPLYVAMKLELLDKIGEGAFSAVYKAQDELGRIVAVKIISPSMAAYSDAIEHAKVLARTEHENVVKVFSIERVTDPKTKGLVDGIVMEYLDGQTLEAFLKASHFTVSKVRALGTQIISGLRHIHAQGLAHGDLHQGNIMICQGNAKLLDILYEGSLALLSTTSKDERLRRDIVSLRFILTEVIRHSELDAGETVSFQNALVDAHTLDDIESAFVKTVVTAATDSPDRHLTFALSRFEDDGFVAGSSYAAALIDETPRKVFAPLLLAIIERHSTRDVHESYLAALWAQLTIEEKKRIVSRLGKAVDQEVPNGRWWPHVRMLRVFGPEAWQLLQRVTALRLEKAITNDILSGRKDIYSSTPQNSGALGTWAISLWPCFEDREAVIQNIASMLSMNWYTQNYIAERFFPTLPEIANTPARKEKFVSALVQAIRNKAHVVQHKLTALPVDWQDEIRRRVTLEDEAPF